MSAIDYRYYRLVKGSGLGEGDSSEITVLEAISSPESSMHRII